MLDDFIWLSANGPTSIRSSLCGRNTPRLQGVELLLKPQFLVSGLYQQASVATGYSLGCHKRLQGFTQLALRSLAKLDQGHFLFGLPVNLVLLLLG